MAVSNKSFECVVAQAVDAGANDLIHIGKLLQHTLRALIISEATGGAIGVRYPFGQFAGFLGLLVGSFQT